MDDVIRMVCPNSCVTLKYDIESYEKVNRANDQMCCYRLLIIFHQHYSLFETVCFCIFCVDPVATVNINK